MSSTRNRVKTVIYAFSGIIIISLCTLFVLKLIWDLWFPPFFKPIVKNVPEKVVEMRVLAEGIQPDNYTVGYKNPSGELLSNRFHDWEIPVPKDSISVCINCHGSAPHNHDERTRALLNKHDIHIACEICHMENHGGYSWYNIATGQLRQTMELTTPLLISVYKIIQTDKGTAGVARPDLMEASNKLLKEASSLSAEERKNELEKFHKDKLKTPVSCKTCHTGDTATSYLPLELLGYTQFRILQIITTEVVGMVTNYEEFYLPTFLSNQPPSGAGVDTTVTPGEQQ